MFKIITRDEYVQAKPRVAIRRGDWIKVRGGSVFVTSDWQKIDMGVRGTFKFICWCKQGSREWLEVNAAGMTETVFVGRRQKSKTVEGLVLVPHRIRKCRTSTIEKMNGKARRKAKRAKNAEVAHAAAAH